MAGFKLRAWIVVRERRTTRAAPSVPGHAPGLATKPPNVLCMAFDHEKRAQNTVYDDYTCPSLSQLTFGAGSGLCPRMVSDRHRALPLKQPVPPNQLLTRKVLHSKLRAQGLDSEQALRQPVLGLN
ncbi:hypothetical protein NDU88_001104 [Pleurodeles waltl]|uniref:Uncharacterized protein n=1 Tax=Pleurodeles waltl TaxID=8319 RepID=A0AAV7R8S2_PLEWA|nr:hypothetical protein NDU88_001104 [Pleurodeles waltl]